jgi:molybdopterin-guanine dinucleotide biosynthesis protein A
MNCYILIGGRSRRMGAPKADLLLGGSSFLHRVAGAAGAAFETVVAVQRNGGDAPSDIPTIHEPAHQDQAPIFGVARALAHAGARCFVIGVDYPLISSAVLRHLRETFESSAALLVAPCWSLKVQMLCAGYSPELLPRIEQRIAAQQFALRGIAADSESEILPEEGLRRRFAGEPLMNVNTPRELQEAAGFL